MFLSPASRSMSKPTIVFSHGKDGDPWGPKIVAMADVAKRHGLQIESIDYRGMEDPAARVAKALAFCRTLSEPVILVGSSLGGHVATSVSAHVPTRGMFLLAPAFFMQGFEQYTPTPGQCPIEIVHGWSDTIVPVENSIKFAQLYKTTLHVLDSDHRLTNSLEIICELLDAFLRRLLPD
jgi:pimeloyl-ACP methyl ester carboxylesterase